MSPALSTDTLMLLGIAVPALAAVAIPLFHRWPNLRELVTLVGAGLLAAIVWNLAGTVYAGARPQHDLFQIVPGVELAFAVEPLGMLFALVAGTLWLVNSIYSIGYMRANDEPRQTSFYVCFAVAIAATMGIAFAKNLFTLFVFYEVLTLSTYPLVTHKGTPEAMRAGRVYLVLLLGTSMVLLLPAIIATAVFAGTLDFKSGGILAGTASAGVLGVLLALYVFGIGKAALMPLHFWLPAAMVAPTPVSALLHAVAVVKAGVFCVLKIVIYVFGLDLVAKTNAAGWLVYAAAFTLIAASLVALRTGQSEGAARLFHGQPARLCRARRPAGDHHQRDRRRHAHRHACGRQDHALLLRRRHLRRRAQDRGKRARRHRPHRCPITMTRVPDRRALASSACPRSAARGASGTWGSARRRGPAFMVVVLMVSSLLNVAYLISIVGRAFFNRRRAAGGRQRRPRRHKEAPLPCLIALCTTAALCIVLFFAADFVEALVGAASEPPTAKHGVAADDRHD